MLSPLLRDLNAAQQQAVQATRGPVLVLAGPGSGKTRVLTHRIAYLIAEEGIDPFNILAVTFTNKAAREMRTRLDELVGGSASKRLTVGTFHSLCARFLRRDIVHFNRASDFAIYDTDDQRRLMERVLRDLNLDKKKYPPRAILARISSAKNELIDPPTFARYNQTHYDELVTRCYEHYQRLLLENNALDFDDLLCETVRLFEQFPAVLAHYHNRFFFLLVDEYQDTNRVQYMLVRQLAAQHRNLFVVGDEDQSIYGWRGADIRNIQHFEQDYPDARVFLLEQNYRSTQAVLELAQAVIQKWATRTHAKTLWTQNDAGQQVALYQGFDQSDEAQLVVDEIARLLAQEGVTPGEIAVMYRTNAQSRVLEEALLLRSIRYRVVGGIRFYERREIKDLLAYLRLLLTPHDSVSLDRVINVPKRSIGAKTQQQLEQWAASQSLSAYAALRLLAAGPPAGTPPVPFNKGTRSKLLGFLALLDELRAAHDQHNLAALLDLLIERIDFRAWLAGEYGGEHDDEFKERWNNVAELRTLVAEFGDLEPAAQLPALLEQTALTASVDEDPANANAVTCITLHQAKGLEYPIVFLIGLEEGLLPHSRSVDDRERLEEERRLFYVGATRAKERLYLTHTFRRRSHMGYEPTVRSRFVDDVPKEMLATVRERPQAPRSFGNLGTWQSAPSGATQAAPPAEGVRFQPGQRVQHATFGEGTVVSSSLIDGDEAVVVNFAARGEKTLLASFARLQPAD